MGQVLRASLLSARCNQLEGQIEPLLRADDEAQLRLLFFLLRRLDALPLLENSLHRRRHPALRVAPRPAGPHGMTWLLMAWHAWHRMFSASLHATTFTTDTLA